MRFVTTACQRSVDNVSSQVHKRHKKLIRVCFVLFCVHAGLFLLLPNAALADTGFIDCKVTVNGAEYRYQVYVPADFNRSHKWPVIVFLHDNGARGVDGLSQTNAGLASVIRRDRARVPAIVVFPQANTSSRWSSPVMQEQILACLDAAAREFNGDADCFYLIG